MSRPNPKEVPCKLSNFASALENAKSAPLRKALLRGRNEGVRVTWRTIEHEQKTSRIRQSFDQSVVADLTLRQEPDEEEDEDGGTKDEDGDRDDNGYSE